MRRGLENATPDLSRIGMRQFVEHVGDSRPLEGRQANRFAHDFRCEPMAPAFPLGVSNAGWRHRIENASANDQVNVLAGTEQHRNESIEREAP
jgi:hypothetical protein